MARLLKEADLVRSQTGLETCGQYAEVACESFASPYEKDSLPVLICARNEQEDLPATLAFLAKSDRQVAPVVIDNGSQDETTVFAAKMGALVIDHKEPAGKAGALQAGFDFIRNSGISRDALCIDADTLVTSKWSASMEASLKEPVLQEKGGASYGLVTFRHGESQATDILRTAIINLRHTFNHVTNLRPQPRGSNCGFHLTDELIDEVKTTIEPTHLAKEDILLREAILRIGGTVIANVNPASITLTRGDRFSSVKELASVFFGVTNRSLLYGESPASHPVNISPDGHFLQA